jgi:hypothetical protein
MKKLEKSVIYIKWVRNTLNEKQTLPEQLDRRTT